jgi:biopolymer transport protein ExbB/TolQ
MKQKRIKKRKFEFVNERYLIIWAALIIITFILLYPVSWNLILLSLLIVSGIYNLIYVISYKILKKIK